MTTPAASPTLADGLALAFAWLAANWFWLALVPLAQMTHELTHFAVARFYGTDPVIVLRLRTPMSVVYDDRGLSAVQRSAIGLAPTVGGLGALSVVLWLPGDLPQTPLVAIGAAAWLLYTLPSREDSKPVAELVGPDEPLGEPQRSMFIGLGGVAAASWLPAVVPAGATLAHILSQSLGLASLAYIILALFEHRDAELWVD